MPLFQIGTDEQAGWMRLECSDRDFARLVAIKLFGWSHFVLVEVETKP
jgi:hypothetical protein